MTARRELAEEAGLEAEKMEVLIETFNTPGISDQHTTIFLATGLDAGARQPMGIEEGYMTIETVALDDVEALVADGTLVDETTVLGLLLARARLARRDGGAPAAQRGGIPLVAGRRAGALARAPCRRIAGTWRLIRPSSSNAARGRTSTGPRRTRCRPTSPPCAAPAADRPVARALSTLRGFHRFLVEEGVVPSDPTADIPGIAVAELLPKALSEDETERLLGAVVGTGPRHVARPGPARGALRDRGCRVSEVVGLNLGDVAEAVEDGDVPLIRVLGKGDKERVVPLGRLALAALQHWLSGEGRPSARAEEVGSAAAMPRPSS